MVRQDRVGQAIDRKARSEELEPISNPLPAMFQRFSRDRILPTQEGPSHTSIDEINEASPVTNAGLNDIFPREAVFHFARLHTEFKQKTSMIKRNLIPLLCVVAPSAAAQDPDIVFVRSPMTRMHIAVQPMNGFHRVYTVARYRNCQGRIAFARVRCQPQDSSDVIISTHRFSVESENELWAIYFLVPRFGQSNATYQVELGEVDASQLNDHVIRTSFGWEVRRDANGKADFVHDLGGGKAVGILVPQRIARVEGGEIKLQYGYAAAAFAPVPLAYGFTNRGNEVLPDGRDLARKVDE